MPSRPNKPIDWRDLKNREELFFRYFKWRMTVHDLDHSHYCRKLTQGLTQSQKCWFSLLFGMTYRTPQAYAYFYTFPNVEEIDLVELEDWHKSNWQRTTYGTDARYNKGHFHKQVKSVLEWLDGKDIYEKLLGLANTKSRKVNFYRVFNEVSSLFKFGRMTSWIACQCLHDTVGLNIDFDNVLIRNPNSDSSMQSIWNGYCILKGDYDKLLGKYAKTENYTVSEYDLKVGSEEIMQYRTAACDYAEIPSVDVFKWESIWCQFKRLFNEGESKEYPGHSSGDATSRYPYYIENWPEVDWTPFREALLEQPGIICGQTYRNEYNKLFGATGLLLNIHEMFSDMPDAYKKLKIKPEENLVHRLFVDHGVEAIEYREQNKIERVL